MADHDRGYKLLFSHPRMVRDLLRGFVRGPWVSRLDLASLERVTGSFVSDDLRERHNDVIWRLRWADASHDGWLYLVLEFQSAPQPFMALRLVVYAGLLLQTLIRGGRLKTLPAVLPVVLYNGRKLWRAPRDLGSLFGPMPQELRPHLPGLEYVLVDGGGGLEERAGNLVSALFRVEASKTPSELAQVASEVSGLLPRDEEPELRRAFTFWMTRALYKISPGATISEIQDLEDLAMLEENMRDWYNRGVRKSRREGLLQGARRILLRAIESRFGPLPKAVEARVHAITAVGELEKLAEKVVAADSIRDLGLA